MHLILYKGAKVITMDKHPIQEFFDIYEEVTGVKYSLASEDAGLYTVKYIKDNAKQDALLRHDPSHLYKNLCNIFNNYFLGVLSSDAFVETLSTSDRLNHLFIEATREPKSKDKRVVKKDLQKMIRHIDAVIDIYQKNYAGAVVDEFIDTSGLNKRRPTKALEEFKFTCEKALRFYSPEQGRKKSQERQARINMIKRLIPIFEFYGLPTGSGEEGHFFVFIVGLYELLKIEVNIPTADIKEAKKS